MKANEWFDNELTKYRRHPDFILEQLTFDITAAIRHAMDEKGISRSDLARKLRVSPAYITKLLNSSSNLTLRTLVNIALALDLQIDVKLQPRRAELNLRTAEVRRQDIAAFQEAFFGVPENYEEVTRALSLEQVGKQLSAWMGRPSSEKETIQAKERQAFPAPLAREETALADEFGWKAVEDARKAVKQVTAE